MNISQTSLDAIPVEVPTATSTPLTPPLTSEQEYTFRSEPTAQDIQEAVLASESFAVLLQSLSQLVLSKSNCLGLWYCDCTDLQPSSPVPLVDETEDVLGRLEISNITWMAKSAAKQSQLVYHPSVHKPTVQFVSCPIFVGNQVEGTLVGCFSTQQESPVRHHWLLTLSCQAITGWIQAQDIDQSQSKLASLNDAMALVKALDSTTSIAAAGRAIVNHMQRLISSEQVSFVHRDTESGKLHLKAMGGLEQIDETAPVNQTIRAACRRAIELEKATVYPSHNSEDPETDRVLEQYCRASRLDACICLPLLNHENQPLGCLLIGGDAAQLSQPKVIDHLQLVAKLIAGHLGVVFQANLGIVQRAKASLRNSLRKRLARKITWITALAAGVMLIPWPYQVACDCQLEPVVRRFVAAPYDGILERTLAKSGDIVLADQLLATMDGRSLRIQLSGLEAELDGARKRRDTALADRDIAQSQIARSEMKRHQAEIQLLQRRLQNLEVKSPIAGIIVSGDLEKAEGAPLETGQTLFEVGPLDEMLAEIQVPESEIRFVQPGQDVKIKLTAYPFKTFHGTVKHIHTRAEIVTDKNVFIAEVVMDNSDGQLKPGMAGSARITSGTYPIGWNLFHGAWDKARYWLMW